MPPIDPAGRGLSMPVGLPEAGAPFDPAAVLLALSAQQAGILQNLLTLQVDNGLKSLGRISEMGSAARDLGNLTQRVVQLETEATQPVLDGLSSLAGRGGQPLTEAEMSLLPKLQAWGATRGYAAPSLVEWRAPEPPAETPDAGPQTATGSSEEAGPPAPPPAPEPQPFLNPQALDEALGELRGYLQALSLGTAESPSLGKLIQQGLEATGLGDTLSRYQLTPQRPTLAGMAWATEGLLNAARAEAKALADAAPRLGSLTEALRQKGAEVATSLRTVASDDELRTEETLLAEQLRSLQLSAELRNMVAEFEAALAGAAVVKIRDAVDAGAVEQLIEGLAEPERVEAGKRLEEWKLSLHDSPLQAGAVAPPPNPASVASMRRQYM